MLLARERLYANARVNALFHGFIVQPRIQGQKVKGMTASMEDLDAFRDIILQAQERKGEFEAGDHCRFCPELTICETVTQHALTAAQESFGQSPASQETVDRWLQLMEIRPVLTKLLKELPGRLLNEIKRGGDIPGYKAVQSLGDRTWTNEPMVAEQLAAAEVEPYEAPRMLSPAKAEKLLGKEAFAALAPLITRPSKGVTLAPEKDKRPAVSFTAIEDSFGVVT